MVNSEQTVITFIRHGVTDWNEAGRMQGHTDIPLNAQGRAQARQTADYLATLQPDRNWQHVYCSDLARARDTAAAIAVKLQLPLTADKALRERSLGPLEGLVWSQVEQQWPELVKHWPNVPDALLPGGLETPAMVGRRAVAWCDDVWRRHPGQRVLVVSHGGWIGSLCQQLGYNRPPRARIGNCSLTTIAWGKDGGHVLAYAERTHLQPLGRVAGQ